MKLLILNLTLLLGTSAFAATPAECLSGKFEACREIFNKYGAQSNREGAVELFEKACSAQTLLVSCEIVSVKKSDSLKKILSMITKEPFGEFVIDGGKIDKIYKMTEVK